MDGTVERMLEWAARRGRLAGDRKQVDQTRRMDDVLDHLNRAIKGLPGPPLAQRRAFGVTVIGQILTLAIDMEQAARHGADRKLLGVVNRRDKRGLTFSAAARPSCRTWCAG